MILIFFFIIHVFVKYIYKIKILNKNDEQKNCFYWCEENDNFYYVILDVAS